MDNDIAWEVADRLTETNETQTVNELAEMFAEAKTQYLLRSEEDHSLAIKNLALSGYAQGVRDALLFAQQQGFVIRTVSD